MKPERIFLQQNDEQTWCEDVLDDTDIEYIRLDVHNTIINALLEQLRLERENGDRLVKFACHQGACWCRFIRDLDIKYCDCGLITALRQHEQLRKG